MWHTASTLWGGHKNCWLGWAPSPHVFLFMWAQAYVSDPKTQIETEWTHLNNSDRSPLQHFGLTCWNGISGDFSGSVWPRWALLHCADKLFNQHNQSFICFKSADPNAPTNLIWTSRWTKHNILEYLASMLVFPSLSSEIWKPIPDLPFWRNPSPPTKLYFATKTAKNFTFSVFSREKKGRTPFSGKKKEKNTKNSKFWIFFEKWPIWATFFSKIVPRFFPGSCPFLPGSCPVLAPVLARSARFSSSFWGFFNFWGFSSVFVWDQKKSQKNRNFRSEGEKSAKFRNFRSECERSQNSESCTNFSGLGQQNPETSRP